MAFYKIFSKQAIDFDKGTDQIEIAGNKMVLTLTISDTANSSCLVVNYYNVSANDMFVGFS